MIYVVGILVLVLMSKFWIGTEEKWNEIVANELIPALIPRTIFLVIIGLVFLGFSFIIHFIFKKEYEFNKELMGLILFSFVLNVVMMLI